jgi:hypothetical protein
MGVVPVSKKVPRYFFRDGVDYQRLVTAPTLAGKHFWLGH